MTPSLKNGDIASASLNCIAAVVCLLAAILVFALKLHKKFVYRLALYQVLSSMAFATVEVFQVIFLNYDKNREVYGRLCTAIGLLNMYTRWTKLLSTMWVTLHIFCFGVLRKDLKKYEVWYVVTSLLLPCVMAVVPLITNTYQLSPFHSYCYVYQKNDSYTVELVEKLVLWDAPALIILLAASTAMMVLVIKIVSVLCRRLKYKPLADGDQYWKALKELLPLAAFPVLFFVFVIPTVIFHIDSSVRTPSDAMIIIGIIPATIWGLSSGITLIIHLSVARFFALKKMHTSDKRMESSYTYSVLQNSA